MHVALVDDPNVIEEEHMVVERSGQLSYSCRQFDPGLGLKKSHSPIPLKAHGKGPTVGRLGCGPLCMGGQNLCSKAQVKDQPMGHSHR
jgi:hypothetical protein